MVHTICKGGKEIKKIKKHKRRQLELFEYLCGETLSQKMCQFVQLHTELTMVGVTIEPAELNMRLLSALPPAWKHTVTVMKQTEGMEMDLDVLFAKIESNNENAKCTT